MTSDGRAAGTTGAMTAASDRIAAHLRRAILAGEIQPGQRVRQAQVADHLGASRLPVREALRMLEAEGLIEHQPHRGARVPRLDMHELRVVYMMRERLEPLALAESLAHLRSEDLQRLDELQDEIERNDDDARFLELDRELHLLTYAGCPIDQLTSMVTRLWNTTQPYRRAYVTLSGPGRRWVINAEHRLLLDAIRRRDTTDAQHCVSAHIRRTRVELEKHPEIFSESSD